MAVWCRKQKGKTTNICVLEQMSGEGGGGEEEIYMYNLLANLY